MRFLTTVLGIYFDMFRPEYGPLSWIKNKQYKIVLIRDFPDHATFREKGAKLACADKLGVFLSLTLCNLPPTTSQI